MSDNTALIEALDRNTASNEALTAAVEAGNDGRAAVLEAAKGASTKAAAKPAAAKKEADPAPKDEPKSDPVADSILAYMDGTEGKERDARKAKVKEILGKVGAAKHSEVPADKADVFIRTMKKLLDAGNLITEEADEEEDDLLG